MSTRQPLCGYSLTRPWPWLMLRNFPGREPLRLLNVSEPLPASQVDAFVALHAGMPWDAALASHYSQQLSVAIPPPESLEHPCHVIFAVGQLVACTSERAELPRGQRDWFAGPYAWWILRFTPIEPVQCRPSAGFFTLPQSVLDVVRERYRAVQSKTT